MPSIHSERIKEAARERPEDVILKCENCLGREWELRADCVLECVLCAATIKVTELAEQYRTGTGRWVKTDH